MKHILLLICAISAHLCQAQYAWQSLPSAPKSVRCDDIYFLNPQIGWAIHANFNPTYKTPIGSVYKTTNGGITWQPLLTNSYSYHRSVGFADELTGWVGVLRTTVYPSDTTILKETTDGGLTWHSANLPTPRPVGICGISVVTDSVVYAYGTYYGPAGYLKTTNKGASWTYKDMSTYAGGLVDGYFINKDTGFLTGTTHNSRALILHTINGGTTWDTSYISTRADSEVVWKLVFPTPLIGYASLQNISDATIYNTYFLKTTDGGATWTEYPFLNNYNQQGIGFINQDIGWLGGDYSKPNYKTTDGGLTWSIDHSFGVLTPPSLDVYTYDRTGFLINRFRRFGDTLLYASGNTIYKLKAATTDIPHQEFVQSPAIYNYPNPFTDHTVFSYTLPQPAQQLTFEVFNALGVKVHSQYLGSVAAGSHQLPFTMALPAGLYYYTLRTHSYSLTNKMLVLQ